MVADRKHITLHATCKIPGHAAPGYANLMVTRRADGIELDPHVDGSCPIKLGESQLRELAEALARWAALR